MKRVYSWTRNYSIDAQIVGEIYQSLPEKTPDALLNTAAKKTSPIHSLFNWDDKEAAREYRLVQARVMIASLQVEIISTEGKQEQVRAFIGSSTRGSHVAVLDASDAELTEAEQECVREMNTYRRKWKALQLAHSVISAIDEVNQRVSRRRKKAA